MYHEHHHDAANCKTYDLMCADIGYTCRCKLYIYILTDKIGCVNIVNKITIFSHFLRFFIGASGFMFVILRRICFLCSVTKYKLFCILSHMQINV